MAHQVLPKSLVPVAVRATIERACAQCDLSGRPSILKLVSAIRHWHGVPTLYQEVESAMPALDSFPENAANIIAKDPVMVTNLLHLVNSAYVDLRRPIASPAYAVALPGTGTVKSLVLALRVFDQMPRDPAHDSFLR